MQWNTTETQVLIKKSFFVISPCVSSNDHYMKTALQQTCILCVWLPTILKRWILPFLSPHTKKFLIKAAAEVHRSLLFGSWNSCIFCNWCGKPITESNYSAQYTSLINKIWNFHDMNVTYWLSGMWYQILEKPNTHLQDRSTEEELSSMAFSQQSNPDLWVWYSV